MTAPIVDVAVGVLIRDDGAFLLAQRPAGKPMAGWWEFPGGKLEVGEAVFDAMVREFDEELGLSITGAHRWAERVVVYPHATVRLHFWRSFGEWRGDAVGREGQAFRWEHIDHVTTEPWLAGAEPVRRWLQLPPVHAISHAAAMGVDDFLARLDARLGDGSVRQLLLREPQLDASQFGLLFADVAARCRANGARLLVSSRHPEAFWSRADGVHLTAGDLMRRAHRPDVAWCLASCHDATELAHAGALDCDAAMLGPVLPTDSHPGAPTVGWMDFEARIAQSSIPVYAVGGLSSDDLGDALKAGAHGIAMIRAAWRQREVSTG